MLLVVMCLLYILINNKTLIGVVFSPPSVVPYTTFEVGVPRSQKESFLITNVKDLRTLACVHN